MYQHPAAVPTAAQTQGDAYCCLRPLCFEFFTDAAMYAQHRLTCTNGTLIGVCWAHTYINHDFLCADSGPSPEKLREILLRLWPNHVVEMKPLAEALLERLETSSGDVKKLKVGILLSVMITSFDILSSVFVHHTLCLSHSSRSRLGLVSTLGFLLPMPPLRCWEKRLCEVSPRL